MQEYKELDHMTEISHDTVHEGYYFPHHAVIKEDSITTKLQVVFDASAKTHTGISLNDTLMVGATIQDDIYTLALRFRFYNYVLTTDIEKMYRQINVKDEDKIYQKILWRENSTEKVKTFVLNTVTYGTASARFLATHTLKSLAIDEGERFPLATRALTQDVYVDNFLTGADTLEEAAALRDQLIEISKLAGLNLRQWSSNEKSLIEIFKNNQSQDTHLLLDSSSTIKTLGIYWNAQQDKIKYKINLPEINTQCITKRTMLSQIASLFDPLGLLGPVVIVAKILMQDVWKQKVEWDESVPLDTHSAWKTFKQELVY